MSKFKVGDVVKTRDGRNVKILCVDAPGAFPIIGFMADGFPSCWTLNGQVCGDEHKRGADLTPPKRTREVTVWCNLYSDGWTDVRETEGAAKDIASCNLVKDKLLAVAVPCKITVEY